MLATSGILVIASLALGQVDDIPSNHEHLEELEYFVGHWRIEGTGPQGSDFTGLRSYRWVLNKNFLATEMVVTVDDRQVWVSMGMIGWDPSEETIKQWTADGMGGIGMISWSRDDNGGTGKYSGFAADGRATSATHVISGTGEGDFTYVVNDLKIGDNEIPEIKFEFTRTDPPESPLVLQTEQASSENYDRLKQGEYFVGEWAGKGTLPEGQEFTAQVATKWTLNKNFLARTLTAKIDDRVVYESRSLRGWDPSTAQVKRWDFNSWGGIAEAVVTREGDKTWTLKSQGVAADGRKASSKRVVTIDDENTYSMLITDQNIDGESMGDIRAEFKREK